MLQLLAVTQAGCRRTFPRHLLHRITTLAISAVVVLVAQVICTEPVVAATASARPNIVIIMADDMGYSDLGCYGGEIETPNLNTLAKNGLRFTQFYNTARCCPTRAALLTGIYQHQAGIGHMVGNYGLPSYQGYLNDQCVTIAEALKPAGYRTLTTGKWHVGSSKGHWPLDRGFDRYFGTPSGGGVYFKGTLKVRSNVFFVRDDERVEFPDDGYVTDLFTDYAIEFVNEAARGDQPFFLYLAHIAPHWPLQARPEDIAKYKGRYDIGWDEVRKRRYARQVEMGIVDSQWELSPRHPQAKPWEETPEAKQNDLAHRMEIYAAQIDSIDQNVGRLVEKLEALGVLDNTVIFFLSDNGCSAEGGPGGFSRGKKGVPIGAAESYASVGLEWANAADTPFQQFKMNVHEGGIATPLVVHWPAGIERRGELERQPGHVIDLLPTCVDVAGAEYPAKRNGKLTIPVEGRSLAPAFAGDRIARDDALYFEHQGNRAVREGQWKLVSDHKDEWELYNMETDRTELNNVAEDNPELVTKLADKWLAWAKRAGVVAWPVKRKK